MLEIDFLVDIKREGVKHADPDVLMYTLGSKSGAELHIYNMAFCSTPSYSFT